MRNGISQDTRTHSLSQTVATCLLAHIFFFSFLSLSPLPKALSGRLLVDPLGFLLAFEIISLFPAVAGLGTSAERQRERKSPESRWGCSLNSSTILTVSNCLILPLWTWALDPIQRELPILPCLVMGFCKHLQIRMDNNHDFTTSFTDSPLCIKAM